jgi:hypothetical protein
MTHEEAIAAADRAATAASGHGDWLLRCDVQQVGAVGCKGMSRDELADAVWRNPDVNAAVLHCWYRAGRVKWFELQPEARVAFEVFRASVLVLGRLVDRAPPEVYAQLIEERAADGWVG